MASCNSACSPGCVDQYSVSGSSASLDTRSRKVPCSFVLRRTLRAPISAAVSNRRRVGLLPGASGRSPARSHAMSVGLVTPRMSAASSARRGRVSSRSNNSAVSRCTGVDGDFCPAEPRSSRSAAPAEAPERDLLEGDSRPEPLATLVATHSAYRGISKIGKTLGRRLSGLRQKSGHGYLSLSHRNGRG